MARRHGRRRHRAPCECRAKGTCYTTWDAAMGAVATTPDAIRAYRGRCCGHYHITKYTIDEYAQRVAELGVQAAVEYGTVDVSTSEEANHEQGISSAGQASARIAGASWRKPQGSAGGPRASSLERGEASIGSSISLPGNTKTSCRSGSGPTKSGSFRTRPRSRFSIFRTFFRHAFI